MAKEQGGGAMDFSFPKFKIHDVREEEDNKLCLIGKVDTTAAVTENWVEDRIPGYLVAGKSIFSGDWHSIETDWKFAVSEVLDESAPLHRNPRPYTEGKHLMFWTGTGESAPRSF